MGNAGWSPRKCVATSVPMALATTSGMNARALHSRRMTSLAKMTPAMGVLNVAPMAAPPPAARRSLRWRALAPTARLATMASAAPSCTIAPSRPALPPVPTETTVAVACPTTARGETSPRFVETLRTTSLEPRMRWSPDMTHTTPYASSAPTAGTRMTQSPSAFSTGLWNARSTVWRNATLVTNAMARRTPTATRPVHAPMTAARRLVSTSSRICALPERGPLAARATAAIAASDLAREARLVGLQRLDRRERLAGEVAHKGATREADVAEVLEGEAELADGGDGVAAAQEAEGVALREGVEHRARALVVGLLLVEARGPVHHERAGVADLLDEGADRLGAHVQDGEVHGQVVHEDVLRVAMAVLHDDVLGRHDLG